MNEPDISFDRVVQLYRYKTNVSGFGASELKPNTNLFNDLNNEVKCSQLKSQVAEGIKHKQAGRAIQGKSLLALLPDGLGAFRGYGFRDR